MQIHFLPFDSLSAVSRGADIQNFPIVGPKQGAANIKSGITKLPPHAHVPLHSHNAEEQVTVLAGRISVVLDGQVFECGPFDSTFISTGVPHEFTCIGEEPATVMVIYGGSRVTRTFMTTGETVEIGSDRDRFPAPAVGGSEH